VKLLDEVTVGNMIQVVEAVPDWPVYADVFKHPPLQLTCRCPVLSEMTSVDSYAVERGLVVGFCGQPHYCNRPYYLTARF